MWQCWCGSAFNICHSLRAAIAACHICTSFAIYHSVSVLVCGCVLVWVWVCAHDTASTTWPRTVFCSLFHLRILFISTSNIYYQLPCIATGWCGHRFESSTSILELNVVYKLQLTAEHLPTSLARPQANQLRAPAAGCWLLAAGCWQLVARSQIRDRFSFHFRYGAAPQPPDGGTSVIIALLDKLIENGRNYSYDLVLCLKILLRNVSMIEMPFKVSHKARKWTLGMRSQIQFLLYFAKCLRIKWCSIFNIYHH